MIPRRAARVLLVDADHRVLLFRGYDPEAPRAKYWFTPGGGRRPDEPAAVAAARELAEETGLVLAPAALGPPVWQDTAEFAFQGRSYRQEQEFFLVRVSAWQVDTDGFDEVERSSIDEHRWWAVAELETTDDIYYPRGLPGLLRRLLTC